MVAAYLTVDDVDALIPRLNTLMTTAREAKRRVETIAAGAGYDQLLLEGKRQDITEEVHAIQNALEEMEDLGAYVKDLDIGIADFLSTFEGRDIFLCWRYGEQRVTGWHELDEGYAQRQEIITLDQLRLD